jgi:hypothetical protein
MKLVLLVAALATTACATHGRLLFPTVIDEYASVRVRIYRSDLRCRIEVITANEVIQTLPSRCVTTVHRAKP